MAHNWMANVSGKALQMIVVFVEYSVYCCVWIRKGKEIGV